MYQKICKDCGTNHRAHEGALDDYGYITIKWKCPKCKKLTMKRVIFQVGPRVSVLTGMSHKGHRERGGRVIY